MNAGREHDFTGGYGSCRGCGKYVEELIDDRYCVGGRAPAYPKDDPAARVDTPRRIGRRGHV